MPSASRAAVPGLSPTPPPHGGRAPDLPNRASIQHLPVAEEAEGPKKDAPKSAPFSWASDDAFDRKAILGPIGLVATAAFIMVVAYLGATMLMK